MKSFRTTAIALLYLPLMLLARDDALSQTTHRPLVATAPSTAKPTPFQTNNGNVPPSGEYSGPLFTLNHAWPTQPLPRLKDAPWQAAINNGTITPQNAAAYAAALKDYVTADGRALTMDYAHWDAAKARWYNEPWLGSQREAIHGTYLAGEFGPGIFPGTGLKATFNTHVLTYYDERAAYTLYKVWHDSALAPAIVTKNTQFDEGAVIVKAAVFASEDPKQPRGWWTAMDGAQEWPMYIGVGPSSQDPSPPPQVWPGYIAQFDIIVKDSQSAPKTGWVFMTLVYDKDAPGDFWDKMVPLGAQWGNDPQATSAADPLVENWNNPKAPLYSTQTLGWGGRLTGPNDGGRNDIAVNGKVLPNEPDSSCISCHSTSQWNVKAHKMVTFLLPSFPSPTGPGFQLCGDDGKPNPNGSNICSPAPGSSEWMKWFQNRQGTMPMDPGSVATDFDEVFSFKSFKLWSQATSTHPSATPLLQLPGHGTQYNQYNGAPLPSGNKPQQ
jgi:hypothetical protein